MPTIYTWHVAPETAAGAQAQGTFQYKTAGPEGFASNDVWTNVSEGNSQMVAGMMVSGKYEFMVVGSDRFGNSNSSLYNSIDWEVDLDGPTCDLQDGYEVVTVNSALHPEVKVPKELKILGSFACDLKKMVSHTRHKIFKLKNGNVQCSDYFFAVCQ